MDQLKIGKFIAALRREKDLTQEALAERLEVTNKTVSRWENGNYLPGIETFQLLSREFGVSINELLSGERVSDDVQYRAAAEENLVLALKSAETAEFSLKQRYDFWRKKWIKEHLWLFVILSLIFILLIILFAVFRKPILLSASIIGYFIIYCLLKNRMFCYIEHKLYD